MAKMDREDIVADLADKTDKIPETPKLEKKVNMETKNEGS
jgi:hypothetical protein